MATILTINDLISPERAGSPNGWVNMGSTEQGACHNFKITSASECGDLGDVELFLQIEAFDPILYQKTVREIELAPGKALEVWSAKDPRIVFTIYGDEDLHNLLQVVESHQTITFTNLVGEQEETVHSMLIEASEEGAILRLKVTLSFKDAEQVKSICCGSYYEEAPFNECDGEGQTGDPSNDPDCDNYEVTIALTSGPDTLTASTVGGGDGVETFKWYVNGVYVGSGAGINPVESGTYRVDAKKGNCSDSAEFTFSLGCDGYEVTTQSVSTGVYVALATLVSTFQWQEFIEGVWEDVDGETSMIFEPDHSGTFRVVATAGDCEATSTEFEFELPADCDGVFSLDLTLEAGTLTVEVVDYEGEEVPSYQWYKDTGSGATIMDGETSASISSLEPGYYTVVVTVGDCIQTASHLIQCDFTSVDAPCGDETEWSQEFVGDRVTLAFTVTNFRLPDPDLFTVNQINAAYLLQVNGVTRGFAVTPADGTKYGIDYPNQEIEFAAGFAPEVGEEIRITKLQWLQI